jgi:hypothetical protein
MIDTKKYTFTFFVTTAIFATAFFASTFFSQKRVENVKFIQDNIAIDILSSETQFDLLKEVPCQNVNDSILSPELSDLGDRLSHTENIRGEKDADVVYLKKYYSLLQVKDYLLSKKVAEKCGSLKKQVFIIYFYSNKGNCLDCQKEGYVLTRLKEKYPELRVYSFDFDLDLSVINSLKSIYKVQSALPVLIIDDKTYTGYQSIEDLEKLLPETLKKIETASTTTSTTSKK